MSSSRRGLGRRDVLRAGLAASALGLLPSCSGSKSGSSTSTGVNAATAAPAKKKRILILGGTSFIGPKIIDVAVARGHTVTTFNRGRREKFLPLAHEVERLYGNRDPNLRSDDENPESPKGLEQLEGKTWDVVIDTSGFFPRMVEASAKLLSDKASRYIYISSISAYAEPFPATGGDETSKLAELEDPKVETMGDKFQHYGGLKVLCERASEAAFPGRAAIVRPGYIVGPGDPTDRFTYWPERIRRGGDVIAPGSPEDALQWIDVRDLADWLVLLAENDTVGVFNAVGPASPGRWGDVLETCVSASGSKAKLEWIPATWLEENGMGEGKFPIWASSSGESAGFHRWSNDRAEATGLKFRSADDTIKSLLAWYPDEVKRRVRVTKEMQEQAKAKGKPPVDGPDPSKLRAGPTEDEERELLAKWRATQKR